MFVTGYVISLSLGRILVLVLVVLSEKLRHTLSETALAHVNREYTNTS